MYDHMTVVQWSVHWAPSQGKALRHVDEKKKKKALLLGLAKSIYYLSFGQVFFQEGKRENV